MNEYNKKYDKTVGFVRRICFTIDLGKKQSSGMKQNTISAERKRFVNTFKTKSERNVDVRRIDMTTNIIDYVALRVHFCTYLHFLKSTVE